MSTRLFRPTASQLEVFILALALLATVIISALTLRQTTKHFEWERTSSFVARFNGAELVEIRERVDRWLETDETSANLFARSKGQPNSDETKAALSIVAGLRTMANYFQEFGTAFKAGSLNERYAHELLGGVCVRYSKSLEPFILEARVQHQRPTVYAEVLLLGEAMVALDG